MPAFFCQRFKCDYCDSEELTQEYGFFPFYQLTQILAPEGWSWMHRTLVCPKHKIVVDPLEEQTLPKDRVVFDPPKEQPEWNGKWLENML